MGFFNVYTTSNSYLSDYFQYLTEQWSSADNTFTGAWNRETGSASTITRITSDEDMIKVAIAVPASDTARLRTTYNFRATPSKFSATANTSMVRGIFAEWEAKFTNVANIDNSTFFMGFSESASGLRTTADIIGFGLSSDAIQTVTDSSGTETTNLPSAITLTNRNLYKMAITEDQVEFWINGNSVATHTTNLPDIMPHFMIYNASEAGGTSTVDLGFCRVFYRGFDDARSF
jgi:hypothetical protein